ncbi:MAG: hypothetical protein E6G06_08255 [Actinobacteria bacterium]|nr:MAG: hypothetical protein E6G06_08255 [Actinomycetota bacterium]
MTERERPHGLGHPALLITAAIALLAIGLILWSLGYTEHGREGGARLTELGAGIIAGAVVSMAFWLVDRAAAERNRLNEARQDARHAAILERLHPSEAAPDRTVPERRMP